MQIDYTAKRTLKSGHSADSDYQINVDLRASDRLSSTIGDQSIALDGTTVTVVHRSEIIYSLTTTIITANTTPDIDDMREFLDSVKFGESFDLDADGSSEAYVLDSLSSPYTETRVNNTQYRYTFRARKL